MLHDMGKLDRVRLFLAPNATGAWLRQTTERIANADSHITNDVIEETISRNEMLRGSSFRLGSVVWYFQSGVFCLPVT